ncbi:gluconate 2-dehydrogenase subunit 3 family protein [Pseudaminobacter sp. 19-2017]|uniref:Gluconate 2-dehydrogenase subunit 3 family protein n=1 Tax=Pseudaminobacter soli (ex Zhang et al. 2022) TaxID=2831468 RepID=A0A942DZT8_9HYPH|nr:gluconate 2-dehydrogenase subunit 3 family protein [Pseudaminobacter soli]MBS3650701.1 gluconate 2-dehydrogenase subunit 3 family protein [Pseudaminobacter soli]
MVTIYTGKPGLSRRELLKRGSAAGALFVISGSAVLLSATESWALETSALKPETMATLIQMARDIYPHDQVPDRYYAIAVKSHDEQAGKDPAHKELIENGIADLDRRSGVGGYTGLGWEEDRVAVLRQIETTPFFQTVRGGLVVSLYNQKEVWPIFGYEGESYSKGGYIKRGFDDIEWL